MVRPSDLLDREPDEAFRETLAGMNAPLLVRVNDLAEKLYGRTDERSVEAAPEPSPTFPMGWCVATLTTIESDVAGAARALLTAYLPV